MLSSGHSVLEFPSLHTRIRSLLPVKVHIFKGLRTYLLSEDVSSLQENSYLGYIPDAGLQVYTNEIQGPIQDYAIPPWFNLEFQALREALREAPKSLREASRLLSEFYMKCPIEDFENNLADHIYSSNAIEEAGLDKFETWRIVKQILAGESIESDQGSTLQPSQLPYTSKLLNKKEVIQHVEAYLYL
ncbi:hypothetical protein TWF506_000285 [Arthrobotrys conoides]|uniref:Uncharacterized protein n=1 Tax=Arthrobotrys conoides TaxID=74498 RepID=A0AAN8RQF1_9PEZI